MARILFAWELGGGLGHVSQLLPMAQALTQGGHEVVFAVRNVAAASKILKDYRGSILQAPIHHPPRRDKRPPAATYAQLLYNCGFDDAEALQARISAWQTLLTMTRCDAVIMEHAPTALAATYGMPLPRLVIGTGFTCPSRSDPLPRLRPAVDSAEPTAAEIESRVLQVVRHALAQPGRPQLRALSDLYYSCNDLMLMTFQELDPFPRSAGAQYWSTIDTFRGQAFQWPGDKGKKRIFAYLKPSPGLPKILEHLQQSEHSTVVYGSWVTPKLMARHNCQSLTLSQHSLDFEQAAAECDLAILNATHGATSKFLLAGKPLLMLPIVQEQLLTAHRVEQMGAGLTADHRHSEGTIRALDGLVESPHYRHCAGEFSRRYDQQHLQQSFQASIDRMHDIVC